MFEGGAAGVAMPPDEAGAKAGEYPCAGRDPAAVAGGTPPPKARESDDGADAGGVAIRGAGRRPSREGRTFSRS